MSLSLILFTTISGAALLCYVTLLVLTLRNGRGRRVEFSFAIYLGAMIVWSLGAVMMYVDSARAPFWNKVLMTGIIVMPLAVYGFVQSFRGQTSFGLMARLGAVVVVVMLGFNALGFLVQDISVAENGLIQYQFGPAMTALTGYFGVFVLLSAVKLMRDLRDTQDFAARNRIKYVLLGLGAIVIGGSTNVFPAAGAVPVDITANLANALIIFYAISRYNLLDLSVIARKGVMYTLSTGLLVAGYLLFVFLGVDLLHATHGVQFLLAVAVAIAVATLLQPGLDWLQGWADRVFFREKYDAGIMLQRLSRQVARLLDIEQLARVILNEVCSTMQTSAAALLIRDRESGEYITLGDVEQEWDERQANALVDLRLRYDNPVVVWLSKHDEVLTMHDLNLQPQFKGLWAEERAALEAAGIGIFIGLTVGRDLVGILVLGPKRMEMPYTPDDLRALQTLANQAAVAVQNAWLYRQALEEKERAQTILQAAAAGIVMADRELRIVTMNPSAEEITGQRFTMLRGRPLTDLLGPDLFGEDQPLTAAASRPPTEVSLDGGGRRCDLLVKMTPLRDGLLVNLLDITQMKEVDRLKSDIVANVSHELRGPLASIKGYTELMLEGMDGDDRALRQRFLSVINEETDRLAGFINDMLDLSRLESGRVELMLTPTQVDALLAEVARGLELQARSAGVMIDVAVPAGLPWVTVDRKLMQGALKNLVSNAIKFSPRGATVEVTGRAEDGMVELEVIDHGPGISAEDLSGLFTKFYRGRAAAEAGVAGTGLGLALVKQTVEQHHGVVTVDTAPGRGARFIVTLPASEAVSLDERPAERVQPELDLAAVSGPGTHGERVR